MLSLCVLACAFICFIASLYESKRALSIYKRAVNHYRGVLSSSFDSWIAWNDAGEMIGASKQLKNLLNVDRIESLSVEDISKSFDEAEQDVFLSKLEELKKSGVNFSMITTTLNSAEKIEIVGAKSTVGGVDTLSLWFRNVTSLSKSFDNLQAQLSKYKSDNEMLNSILDELPIPIWYRSNDLRIGYCNNCYSRIVEASKVKIIEKNIPLISGTLFGQGTTLAENALKTGLKQSVLQFTVFSNVRHKMDIHEIPIKTTGGIVGFANDVTDLDNTTKKLDKLIEAQGNVLESLSSGVVIFDQNMRMTYFNSSYRQIMKFDEIWLSSKPSYSEILEKQRIHRQLPECADFNTYKQDQLKLFSSLITPVQELLHLPNGSVFRRYIAPYQLGGLIFLYDDVTDSLTLKRDYNTTVAVQKEIVNSLLEGVCIFGSDNKIKFLNPKMRTMFNFAQDSLEMHIADFLELNEDQIDYFGKWTDFKDNVISNLTDRIMKTGRLTKRDGTVLFFSYTPLPDGSHMHSYMDITDTCNVNLAMHEKNQAIRISNNIKYEFIEEASSEIKEPVNLIIGFSDLLKHQYFGELNEKQQKYCECILESSNKLLSFIDHIVEMKNIDMDTIQLSLEQFDVVTSVGRIINTLRKKSVENGILLTYVCKSNGIKNIVGDKSIIKQLVFFLGSNCIKDLKSSGRVSLNLEITPSDLVITLSRDTTAKAQNTRIHRRMTFTQATDICFGSMDIWLPTVRTLVQKHNGTVSTAVHDKDESITCRIPITLPSDNRILAAG